MTDKTVDTYQSTQDRQYRQIESRPYRGHQGKDKM